jgi:hypothetical protein
VSAAAHGVGDRYDLPAPLAHFIAGASATVALSFVVTVLVARGRARAGRSRDVTVSLGALGALGWGLGRTLGIVLLGVVLVAGVAGNASTVRNIAPTLVWVAWWVGLSLFVAFIGNVWPCLDPWRALFDGADALVRRARGGRGLARGVPYPPALGLWPAALLLLAVGWCELVDLRAPVPRHVAALALVWSALTWTGMLCFGPAVWRARGDVFAVYFAALGRFAPLAATADGHALRVRPLGRGLMEAGDAPPGGVAFVVVMLAVVLFDGLLGTRLWRLMDGAVDAWAPGLDREGYGLATGGLIAVWLALLGAYVIACRLTEAVLGARERRRPIAPAFVWTLVPIAVGYAVAHNLGYLLLRGQDLIPLVSDPLGRGWDLFGTADWMPDPRLVSPGLDWYVAVGSVVAGHVISIWLAHRLMLGLVDRPQRAALASLPLTILMVGYTALSLWIIAEPLVRLPDANALKPHAVVGAAGAGRTRVHTGLEPAEAIVGATDTRVEDAGVVERHQHEERQLGTLRRRRLLRVAVADGAQRSHEDERSEPAHRRTSDQGRTIRSISTAPPSASAVTPTVVRAGRRPGGKCLAYSALTSG